NCASVVEAAKHQDERDKERVSVARTPQQNGIAKRKNRTLIDAARTMLTGSLLPIPFWTEAVNTTCYVRNRVLVTKPHNKTPYELLLGRTPSIGFMRPFACPVTIINILDPLGKFNGKDDERFLVGYSVSSKAFRVCNSRIRIIQETLHINFLENQSNVAGSGPTWMFNIDTLTQSMNYQLVVVGNQPNFSAGIQENLNAGTSVKEAASVQQYPESAVHASPSSSNKIKKHDEKTKRKAKGKSHVDFSTGVRNLGEEFEDFSSNNTNEVNVASTPVTAVGLNLTNNTNNFNVVGPSDNAVSSTFEIGGKTSFADPSQYPDDPNMPALEDITYLDDEEDVGAEADFSNLETSITIKPIPTTRVHKDHPVTQIIGDLSLAPQTRSMTRMVKDQGFADPDYHDKVYKVVKALYGLHQALRAWYETLANYLLENGFQRIKIDQTLFIKKQKGNILIVQFYVDDIIFRSTNKELCKAFKKLMKDKFQMSSTGELTFFLGLQVKQKINGIFISQDKYVAKILRKFGLTDGKLASNPIDTKKPLLKDPDVKRIFRYLKGKPRLGLMYPKDSPFNLVAYSDSDYAGASLDRKSTTGGCQFLGCRLISWQCKKETVVSISSTKAEYVAAASCCAQVLWIQNQLLDYGQLINAVSLKLMLFGLTNDAVHLMLLGQKASISIKKSNDVMRLQALIDRRKVIIIEDSIRQALRLNDADGVDCLPNEESFTELARMGYEKLSTKLTFYKEFFLAKWKFLIHTIL
nr:putative ribonuclease H-like domain-containing protein [Tanacetum cinerariifolium]